MAGIDETNLEEKKDNTNHINYPVIPPPHTLLSGAYR